MRKFVLIATLFAIAAGCSQPDPAAEKAAVESVVRTLYASFSKSDPTIVKNCFTPDFSGFEEGVAYNIDVFLDYVRQVEPGSFTYTMDFIRTDLGKDLSHCIIKAKGKYIYNKMPTELDAYENYILKKTNGKWLICAYHSTHFNGPKKMASGCVLGVHTYAKLDPKPGVTQAQVDEFWSNKFIPAFNRLTDEMQIIPMKGDRGEGKDKPGYIVYIVSAQVRDSYWNAEGKLTPKGEELFKKMTPNFEERDKLFKVDKDSFTDWIVN